MFLLIAYMCYAQVKSEWEKGKFELKAGDEDIHTANERRLKVTLVCEFVDVSSPLPSPFETDKTEHAMKFILTKNISFNLQL